MTALALVIGSALWGGAVGAQGPVLGATAPPVQTPAPGEPIACPVSEEAAGAITGTAVVMSAAYPAPPGGLYVERLPRVPGGDPETTSFTCSWLSAGPEGTPPSHSLFLSFSIGESADYLWGLNGPGIEADATYVALVDGDPATPDTYSRTDVYPQGEAFPVRTVVGRQYVHAAGVFADVIVSVADEDMTETQVALMADQVALLLWEAVGPSAP